MSSTVTRRIALASVFAVSVSTALAQARGDEPPVPVAFGFSDATLRLSSAAAIDSAVDDLTTLASLTVPTSSSFGAAALSLTL
jgi:hypothetical protein